MGVVAYPGYGICKSLHTLTHTHTRKATAAARQAEGRYLKGKLQPADIDVAAMLQAFDNLKMQ